MAVQLNGSSYYRANPFYQQGYIPDSAFKNRKSPAFIVQIPQGKEYFQPTNKKHFQRVGYYSTIAEEGIINKDIISSPAREKQYFRSLNVEDIEGTSTNTLISQAVKNKLKAKHQLAQRQREHQEQEAKYKKQYFQRIEDESKRMQALTKMNRIGQPNYHQKVMKLKTEESERKLSPEIRKVQNTQIQNYHNQKYEKFKSELQKTENQIKQLERQLREGTQEPSSDFSHQYQSLPPKQSQSQICKPQYNFKNIRDQQRDYRQLQKKYPYERTLSNKNYKPFGHNEKPNPGRISHPDLTDRPQKLQNLGIQPQNQIYGYPMQPANIQSNNEPNRQRSYTQKPPNYLDQKNNKLSLNNTQEIHDPQLMRREQESPSVISKGSYVKQAKEEHRRHNPTYLSYASPAIGLAGRNIVGY